jgi:hypothetical protein
MVDQALRRQYRAVRSSVICSNGARGSMAVQGMCFAIEASRRWPHAALNEVHPKVLWHSLETTLPYPREWDLQGQKSCEWLNAQGVEFEMTPTNEHEFDAILAAWITWRGTSDNFFDLADACRRAGEELVLPVGRASYFWPRQIPVS